MTGQGRLDEPHPIISRVRTGRNGTKWAKVLRVIVVTEGRHRPEVSLTPSRADSLVMVLPVDLVPGRLDSRCYYCVRDIPMRGIAASRSENNENMSTTLPPTASTAELSLPIT